jgi:hypothetical protein
MSISGFDPERTWDSRKRQLLTHRPILSGQRINQAEGFLSAAIANQRLFEPSTTKL